MEKVSSENWFTEGNEEGYDAIVVGSGYGGSVAACRLSMAGLKVCLIEKGRKWEAQDFPTDSLKIWSSTRIEDRSLGFKFGSKDALFQIYHQDDSVAAMACGLGGGSLVNAGVMLPTPIRARRNPKWPKEWERNWEICQALASAMLRIQSVPNKFPNAKIMEEMTGDEYEETSGSSLKLSVNFDIEEQSSDPKKSKEIGSCLACGNCLAGCPYNAKLSTDKTYLVSALQAGCTIKTECQVQYVVRNPKETCIEEEKINRKRRRRWLVFLNETDYVTADFVVLSAGVFGTSNILFQSQMRGLKLSERLGFGLSCNGNTVAYLVGSPAPLNTFGLDRKQFSNIPFQERPGPAISSSYTSSLGITIQSAVLPTAYPYLVFEGIATYGWPPGYWFLHGIIDKIKHILGSKSQSMVLNAMGYDDSDGKITFEKKTNSIRFQPPRDPFLARKINAFEKLTKKLGGILFMSRYRSTSVHLLGGCIASSDYSQGVCNPNGQIFYTKSLTSVHPGLYVCDASLIPSSVGVNPCLTIATVSEHVSKQLVEDALEFKNKEGENRNFDKKSGSIISGKFNSSRPSVVSFKETMRGHIGGMECTAYLILKMNYRASKDFEKSHPLLRGKVGGYVEFRTVEMDKLYVIDGEVDLCEVDNRTPYTQYMHYHLLLAASSGSRYILEGKKVMNPYLLALYAWKDSTTMHVKFREVTKNSPREETVNLEGMLRISLADLLKSIASMEGRSRGKFVVLLLQSLFRTYVVQAPRLIEKCFTPLEVNQRPYPSSTLHEIKTEDGFVISCKQWKCSQTPWKLEGERESYPVLLINGYSAESYCLPTEPNDLVRTLLEKGHETWLLQSRLHPLNPSNDFTIEDIGRIDIPAAINKILELHRTSIKIHVVAHCVGGLAIHIALMGGYIFANQIASLSCINSSMFFKITPSSNIKMWLPLIPMSMAILGKNKTLPLFQTLNATSRQHLVKSIARFMPRCERCTIDECEVFSGIFGNAFWHSNVTPTMHYWLNKQNLPRLPMAAFPHLRKICRNGFIVDNNGKNEYLIHPERMELPTLYISGGKTLLVTPETSFLANKYMKLHQPSFRHERVVVEGFGHSDLLIGEESWKKVFPHIISHMELAEKERTNVLNDRKKKSSKEALAWCDDFYKEEKGGFGTWIFSLVTIWLLLMFYLLTVNW